MNWPDKKMAEKKHTTETTNFSVKSNKRRGIEKDDSLLDKNFCCSILEIALQIIAKDKTVEKSTIKNLNLSARYLFLARQAKKGHENVTLTPWIATALRLIANDFREVLQKI